MMRNQKAVLVNFVYITTIRSHFRESYGPEGPVRNRFAERESEELQRLIAELDCAQFS